MKRVLLIILLLPLMAIAQEVKPVISDDYLALIKKKAASQSKTDSTNSMRNATLHFKGSDWYNGYFIRKISKIPGDVLNIQRMVNKVITFTGAVSATVELQYINRLPAVQNEYVQGRSVNGVNIWRGAETGEVFSYGPSVHSLVFDGSVYPYDVNGRLISNANGPSAIAYNNSMFRPATLFSHAVTLNSKYKKEGQQVLSATIKAGQSREQTFISSNNNKADNFSTGVEATVKKFLLDGSYSYRQEHFSHNNRDGFLNRVYRNSLITPISFSNRQGNTIGSSQRSYNPQADNPFFLLANKDHFFLQQQHTANLGIEKKIDAFRIRLAQSIAKTEQRSNEGYQPGTAFFTTGAPVNRNTHDDSYSLNANLTYIIPYGNHFKGQARANYIYANEHAAIDYWPEHSAYRYQRSSNDLALSFSPEFSFPNIETGWVLSNKIYASNTSRTSAFFLPGISGYARLYRVPGINDLSAKLFGSFNRFTSEPSISQSFASSTQLQYSAADASQWLPVTELSSFDNLVPAAHYEFISGIEMSYKNKLQLNASWFDRHTTNDLFPVMQNGEMNLKNIANHRNRGIDLELSLFRTLWKANAFFFTNTINYVSYRSKVTDVKDGYNYMPIAGFSDVHKAIVKGQPLGVIIGNTWLRDAGNNIIIGADGFPLVNNTPSVIGDPVPDFTIKVDHRLSYKDKWDLDIDWEWKKGGDIWNGTQALLDYYGRSANSAALRNTTNYVFAGVQANGSHNTTPVSFYDPSKPVEQNRWIRYGESAVAESYIQKGDCIRLRSLGITYRPMVKKYVRKLALTLYANNIILWSAYKGSDPNQLLNDQPGSSGLDFFNLPSTRSFGFNISLQF